MRTCRPLALLLLFCLTGCGRVTVTGRNDRPGAGSRPHVTTTPSFDGGSVGNGGDDTPLDEGAAWFLGDDEPVYYCVQVAPDFGVAQPLALAHVAETIEAWRVYITQREVNQRLRGNFPSDKALPPIATSFLPSCDGRQRLTFYLGGMPADVARHIVRYNRPLGFAQRLSYDAASGRGRGFIWLQSHGQHSPGFPDWRIPQAVRAMLLHEIGHVLGCAHVRGTVMSAQIVDDIRVRTNPPRGKLGHWMNLDKIDQRRALLLRRAHHTLITNSAITRGVLGAGLEAGYAADPIMRHVQDIYRLFDVSIELTEVGRQRNDASVFRRSFLNPMSGATITHAFATEAITFVGPDPEQRGGSSLLAELNGDHFALRLWRVTNGTPVLLLER